MSLNKGRKATNPFHAYMYRAIRAGLEFKLTEQDVHEFIAQNCYYCGRPSNGTNNRLTGMGIDRLNSAEGYNWENCVAACQRCNSIKAGFEQAGLDVETVVAKTRERVLGYSPRYRSVGVTDLEENIAKWQQKAAEAQIPLSHWLRDLANAACV